MEGQTLDGHYHLLRALGAGAMGSVYEAEQIGTGRRVAVKVMAAVDAQADASLVSRFELEARATGQLETPHIVRAIDAGTDAATGCPYLVMELLRGETLHQLIDRRGPLSPALALRIAAQACMGLAEAHAAGLIHRDVKSANLFLARGEHGKVHVKILDFGLAKATVTPLASNALTRTGTILGSPLFMAPEQARGAKDADARSDLWSLGVVLFHALTGRIPHDEIDGLGELLITICSEPAPRVRSVAPGVSPAIDALVDRVLQLDPSARYQHAGEMLAALDRLMGGPCDLTEAMLAGEPPRAASPLPPRPSAPPPRPSPVPAALAPAPIAPALPPDPYAREARPSPLPPPVPAARPSLTTPLPPAPVSLGSSDQGVVSPALPAPRRQGVRAPLVLLAAALFGALSAAAVVRFNVTRSVGTPSRQAAGAAVVEPSPYIAARPIETIATVDAGAPPAPAPAR